MPAKRSKNVFRPIEFLGPLPISSFLESIIEELADRFERGDYEDEAVISREMREVVSWLYAPKQEERLSPKERLAKVQELLNSGVSVEEIRRQLKALNVRNGPGRPVTARRKLAVAALDARLSPPWPSWSVLARRFCQCDEATRQQGSHGKRCQDSLRGQVRLLQKYLETQGFPAELWKYLD